MGSESFNPTPAKRYQRCVLFFAYCGLLVVFAYAAMHADITVVKAKELVVAMSNVVLKTGVGPAAAEPIKTDRQEAVPVRAVM